MTEISMRQKIVANYQQKCRDADILPASAYEIQLLIDCAFEALSEPTPAMLAVCWPLRHPWGKEAPDPSSRPSMFAEVTGLAERDFSAMIRAAQEGK
jgi:hypothetical protein